MAYEAELALAKALALEAGDIMLEHFQIGVPADMKHDNTIVTVADGAINDLVIQRIAKAFPTHSMLGEEASNIIEGAEYTWVCDPIDGTGSYSFGIPTNVFSLILTKDGQPLVGVVYDPYLKRLFWAEKGKGAFLDGKQLHVNKLALPEATIGCASLRSPFVNTPLMHMHIEQQARRSANLGSSIYEGILVAAGQLGAEIYVNVHAHDVVASKLFVEEAGGKVTDLYGNDQRYDQPVKGMIASNGIIHDQLLAIVHDAMLEA